MSPEELAVIIEQLVLDADKRYARAIGRVQVRLYDELLAILKDLELTDGTIKQTAGNRKILNAAVNKVNEVLSSLAYTNAVTSYVAILPQIDLNNIRYFTALEEAFKPNKIYLKKIQQGVIEAVNQYVLQDGLQSQVVQPLQQILVQNVNAGGRFSGFIKQVEDFVQGDARLLSYTRTFIRDTLMTYSRTYQQAVTADLGLEYYFYSGGIMDSTREFCLERVGRYYSKKEIEAWAELEWKGKKKGTTETSIFLFAGGWNCGHQIIPVSSLVVPEEVKKRNQ